MDEDWHEVGEEFWRNGKGTCKTLLSLPLCCKQNMQCFQAMSILKDTPDWEIQDFAEYHGIICHGHKSIPPFGVPGLAHLIFDRRGIVNFTGLNELPYGSNIETLGCWRELKIHQHFAGKKKYYVICRLPG
jgi:hypothetical protein